MIAMTKTITIASNTMCPVRAAPFSSDFKRSMSVTIANNGDYFSTLSVEAPIPN